MEQTRLPQVDLSHVTPEDWSMARQKYNPLGWTCDLLTDPEFLKVLMSEMTNRMRGARRAD